MKYRKIKFIGMGTIALIIITIILLDRLIMSIPKEKDNIIIDIKENIECITNKEKIIKDNIVFIGNNQNQISNGFYDIKVIKINNGMKINIISLNKGNNFNKKSFGEYAVELSQYIKQTIRSDIDIVYLSECILNKYNELRVNINEPFIQKLEYNSSNTHFKFWSESNELCLEIRRKDI